MKTFRILLLATIGMLPAVPAMADDIDVFQPSVDANVVRPTVILTLGLDLSLAGAACDNLLVAVECGNLRDVSTVQDLLDFLADTGCVGINLPFLVSCTTVRTTIDLAVPDLNVAISASGVTGLISTALNTLGIAKISLRYLDVLRLIVQSVLDDLVDNANVGVMVSHFDGSDTTGTACGLATDHTAAQRQAVTSCSNGAYVLMDVEPLLSSNLTAFTNELLGKLNSISASASGSSAANAIHPYQGKELYYEAVQYLSGKAVYNGHLGYWDYADSNGSNNLDTSLPALSWSTAHEDGSNNYLSPYDEEDSCGPSFIINVTLGTASHDDETDLRIATDLPNVETAVDDGGLTFEDVILHLETDGFARETAPGVFVNHTINSYFLLAGLPINVSAQTNAYANITSNSVVAGVGLTLKALDFSSTFEDLELDAILGVPGSFTTAVQPTTAGLPARFEPDTFVPLFEPDINDLPVWQGNLKKLTFDAADDRLEDANGAAAVNSEGRIADGTRTIWTDAPLTDGNVVDLGGAGSQIPGFATGTEPGQTNATGTRTLYYEPASGTTLKDLDNTLLVATELQSDFGAANTTEAQELILYARGYEGNNLITPVKRNWMMGAVLHSQPVALNYGATGNGYDADNPDIRVLFGSTDGLFRMVRNTTTGGAQSGEETWAFMPREVMSQVKRMKTNAAGDSMIYGVDGSPAIYINDVNSDGNLISTDGDKVWVFFGLRRGGKAYYALDISDPDNPGFLWKITNSGDFADMGLTFSTPRIGTKIFFDPDTSANKTGPVLLFGGGYNGGVDGSGNPLDKDAEAGSDGTVGTDDSVGNSIYLVDAENGNLLWQATKHSSGTIKKSANNDRPFRHPLMEDSIPSTITALDTDGDGHLDRGYVGDTGGRVWRIDLPGADISNWSAIPILSVGRHNDLQANSSADVIDDRRFFHRPDYVKARDFQGAYDAVVIGSGDRADPFNTTTRNNIYMFKDRTVVSGLSDAVMNGTTREQDIPGHYDSGSGVSLYDVSSECDGSTACPASSSLVNGWRFQLGDIDEGEKMVSTPFTLGGTVFFTTFIPPEETGDCTVLEGGGRLYGVGLADARPVVNEFFQSSDSVTDPGGNDRSTTLAAAGFADSVVYMGDGRIMRSDLAAQQALNRSTYPTFWRERLSAEEVPLTQP